MRYQVPIERARIEWQPDGIFRISHYDEEPCDRSLRKSGGACFETWMECCPKTRVAWLLWHGIVAMNDGCHPRQVIAEMNRVPEFFDEIGSFLVRPSEVRKADKSRGKEASNGEALPE